MYNVIIDRQSFIERLYSDTPRRIVLDNAFLKKGDLITVHEDLNENMDEDNPSKENLSGRRIIYEVIEPRFLLHCTTDEYYVKEVSRENIVPISNELKEEVVDLKTRLDKILSELEVFCKKNHCEFGYSKGDHSQVVIQEVNNPINLDQYEKGLQVESLEEAFNGHWYYPYDQN